MNRQNINRTLLPGLAGLSALTLTGVGLRIYQLFRLVEAENGFYSNQGHWTVWVLYLVAALTAGASVVYALYVCRGETARSVLPQNGKSTPVMAASFLLAAAFLADVVSQCYDLFQMVLNRDYTETLTSYLRASGAVPTGLQVIAALACVFYFVLYGMHCLGRTVYLDRFPILALSPVLWLMLRLIGHFTVVINYMKVSQRMFEMFLILAGMICFFYLAKHNSGLRREFSIRSYLMFGFMTVFFAVLVSLPRLIVMLAGRGDLLVESPATEVTDLMMGVFLLARLADKR
ncbi:MAG: hypothetical protein LIO46_01445 [Clostridiales bacterium]|nr:hypothetical protein [Clostridiales bacterium]